MGVIDPIRDIPIIRSWHTYVSALQYAKSKGFIMNTTNMEQLKLAALRYMAYRNVDGDVADHHRLVFIAALGWREGQFFEWELEEEAERLGIPT